MVVNPILIYNHIKWSKDGIELLNYIYAIIITSLPSGSGTAEKNTSWHNGLHCGTQVGLEADDAPECLKGYITEIPSLFREVFLF